MIRAASLFAAVALLPALCGVAVERSATFELALCSAGTRSIPLRDGPPPAEPCCAKGCHAQRKRAAKTAGLGA